MGVALTPIIEKTVVDLDAFRGRTIAVDGNLELYQFLSVIRLRDGTPLKDEGGRVTSHLNGLMFRTTRLVSDHDIRPVFVFDGVPPSLKAGEIDWDEIFGKQGARWFHTGGIFCALSDSTPDVAIEAMRILTQRHLGAEIETFSYPVVQRESVQLRRRIPAGVLRGLRRRQEGLPQCGHRRGAAEDDHRRRRLP